MRQPIAVYIYNNIYIYCLQISYRKFRIEKLLKIYMFVDNNMKSMLYMYSK
jgi:hypothetical protein